MNTREWNQGTLARLPQLIWLDGYRENSPPKVINPTPKTLQSGTGANSPPPELLNCPPTSRTLTNAPKVQPETKI